MRKRRAVEKHERARMRRHVHRNCRAAYVAVLAACRFLSGTRPEHSQLPAVGRDVPRRFRQVEQK